MRKLPLADRLRIGSPCPLGDAWSEMRDSENGTRFCGSCRKEVHDIASLEREDVLALLRSRSARGGLCIRIHTRKTDGAILLADGHALPSDRLVVGGLAAVATISAAALAGCSPSPPVAPTQYVDIGAIPPEATTDVTVENPPPPSPAPPAAALVERTPLVTKTTMEHAPARPKASHVTTPPKKPAKASTPSKTVPPPDDYMITAGEISADPP